MSRGCLLLSLFLLLRIARGVELKQEPMSPTVPAASQAPSGAGQSMDQPTTTIKTDVNLVTVRAVVRDHEGNILNDLKKEDFQIFDKGKPQVISQFSVEISTADNGRKSAQTLKTTEPESLRPKRYLAYLFDDVRGQFGDLARARDAFESNLGLLQPIDRVALLTTSGQVALDFTSDQTKLRDAIDRVHPNPQLDFARDCPVISYYMADLIVNKYDTLAERDVVQEAKACGINPKVAQEIVEAKARQVLSQGESESRSLLLTIKRLVESMATLPGQRNVILVSPGFLTPGMEYEESAIVDTALRSQTIIGALDPRGVYVVGTKASVAQTSVTKQYDFQEATAISNVLSTLAESTGGIFFHGSNDLAQGFRELVAVPESSYLLAFSPPNLKPDGKFHALKVVLPSQKDAKVQARTGYFAPRK